MRFLTQELGWKWYGGHHLENMFTAFNYCYFLPKRFGIDGRLNGYSALIRSGQLMREEGLHLLEEPLTCNPTLLETVKKRLDLSDEGLEHLMDLPKKTYRDFQTYKPTFEQTRWFWWLMCKLNRVPKSFYLKYALPDLSSY